MPFMVDHPRWGIAKGAVLTSDPDKWAKEELAQRLAWLRAKGLPVPHVYSVRERMNDPPQGPDPRRMGRRAYRRALRAWRRAQFPTLGAQRRALAAERIRQQRWQLWLDDGLALTDPDALAWYMRTRLLLEDWPAAKKGQKPPVHPHRGVNSWLRSNELAKVSGGVLPAGIGWNALFRDLTERRAVEGRGERPVPPPLPFRQRWVDRLVLEAQHAYGASKFTHKHPLELVVKIPETGYARPFTRTDAVIDRGYRKRKRRQTQVTWYVPFGWYVRVFKKGLANVLGERTLVIDARPGPGGVTRVKVVRQPRPGFHVWEIVEGNLLRDEKGEPCGFQEVTP